MGNYYTDEKNVQVIIRLLKEHGIRKVIASPGTTNMSLVASLQRDSFFQMYSSPEERSAAYMACGLAAESGEPVVISCTGATASRNYVPGLTEAFYRKLPVLAITSSQRFGRVGRHIAQIVDRSSMQKDLVNLSVSLPIVKDDEDLWECEVKVNQAILELTRHGGGPVHINLPTTYSQSFETQELPSVRVMSRITLSSQFPDIPQGKVAVFIGAHKQMSKAETEVIDSFCAANDAVVFCDHTSGYKGKYRVLYSLVAGQIKLDLVDHRPDLLIHIGEVTGDYYTIKLVGKNVWRVSPDGEIRDTFRKLQYVFEMPEKSFFEHYTKDPKNNSDSYLKFCKGKIEEVLSKVPELPFSNPWLASKMAHRIPKGSAIHFGILNSLRSWNFFELPQSVDSASNVGGFGIDGGMSTLLGASLANKNKLYFGVIGDLAMFYDLNALGNRHVNKNLRILLVNNGKGTEFKQFDHFAAKLGEDADDFIAATGHYGKKSKTLMRDYAKNLGFEYLCASNKQEFDEVYERFLVEEITERPILFEVFTDSVEESAALEAMLSIEKTETKGLKGFAKQALGQKGVDLLKKAFGQE